jgi:hypothetical protein
MDFKSRNTEAVTISRKQDLTIIVPRHDRIATLGLGVRGLILSFRLWWSSCD